MANAFHHSVSSAKKWGGQPDDYIEIHRWFDASNAYIDDFRHRALRHHTQGIAECEQHFGMTVAISAGVQHTPETCPGRPCGDECDHFQQKLIPTRWIARQHVIEDLGCVPQLADWLSQIQPLPWMNRSKKLSLELEEVETRMTEARRIELELGT